MDTIVEELYHALCRTDTSTAHISDELWEKASAQAGEEELIQRVKADYDRTYQAIRAYQEGVEA